MVDKRGKWNAGDAFDLDKANKLLDDASARNLANDLRRHMGADALKPHKPLLAGPGVGKSGLPLNSKRNRPPVTAAQMSGLHQGAMDFAAANKSPAARSGSKDGDLLSSMAQRLQKLEQMNNVLKSELREKNDKIIQLEDQNQKLKLAADDDSIEHIARITVERDNYKS